MKTLIRIAPLLTVCAVLVVNYVRNVNIATVWSVMAWLLLAVTLIPLTVKIIRQKDNKRGWVMFGIGAAITVILFFVQYL